MGKKVAAKKDSAADAKAAATRASKKRLETGVLYVQSTYNNTRVLLTDKKGNAFFSSSSGALGFRGAKKGTPFAAAKVAEVVGEKSKVVGLKNVDVIVKGVGSGRESAIRAFVSKGFNITSIKDVTPVPHNGVKAKKARRI
jgi:small subunit ribosomal protein S11